jgi:Ni,Fe-hydrogenase maturation factor
MPALVIAIGNPLRRDDGVAHRVPTPPGVEMRAVLQLTPEIAAEIAHYDTVVFVDADIDASQVRVEPVDSAPSPSPLTHVSRPSEIVALARSLFGFAGEAYTCRIPVSDLSEGEELSRSTSQFADQAAREIDSLLAPERLAPQAAREIDSPLALEKLRPADRAQNRQPADARHKPL